jgi:hypothetical protein
MRAHLVREPRGGRRGGRVERRERAELERVEEAGLVPRQHALVRLRDGRRAARTQNRRPTRERCCQRSLSMMPSVRTRVRDWGKGTAGHTGVHGERDDPVRRPAARHLTRMNDVPLPRALAHRRTARGARATHKFRLEVEHGRALAPARGAVDERRKVERRVRVRGDGREVHDARAAERRGRGAPAGAERGVEEHAEEMVADDVRPKLEVEAVCGRLVNGRGHYAAKGQHLSRGRIGSS